MAAIERPTVLLVPGGVMPASLSYGPLLSVIQGEANVIAKDLEVYAGAAPPEGYGLETEVEGIRRVADEAGWQTFHLVGYSGGGAASLAYAARYPERLESLALIEPAWIGNQDRSVEEVVASDEFDRVMTLPPEERLEPFMRATLRPGVEFQFVPGPPPPWMSKRPVGLAAFTRAFKLHDLDVNHFASFHQPVYLAVGSLSNAAEARKAERLAGVFPDCRVEVYEGLHHFNPPHRAEPERFAQALRKLWASAREQRVEARTERA
jgi:pimeloyl-ACP methyl ester carboxylesterase